MVYLSLPLLQRQYHLLLKYQVLIEMFDLFERLMQENAIFATKLANIFP